MNRLTDSKLQGYYGAWSPKPVMRYAAIAVGVMLINRGLKKPKGFDELVSKARDFGTCGYVERERFLKYVQCRDYPDYLRSELWQAIRKMALERDERRCQFCDSDATQVHHSSYDIATLCGARIDRLHSTCGTCHERIEFDNGRKRTFFQAVWETQKMLDRKELERYGKKT